MLDIIIKIKNYVCKRLRKVYEILFMFRKREYTLWFPLIYVICTCTRMST